jgi:hypothetical protein
MNSKRLTGKLRTRTELCDREIRALFEIFSRHYEKVSWNAFLRDLDEKDYIILLCDSVTGEPRGFSTQQILESEHEGRAVRAVFSGDTIIDRAFWGEQELVRAWCRFAGRVLAAEPGTPLYWFLISKGYRTYLFLPLFYREFYPRRGAVASHFEKSVVDLLASEKFGGDYDPRTGLIRFAESHGQLSAELAEIPPARREHPDVQFFLSRNPEYARGQELVCLARIHPDNMKSFAAAAVREGLASGPLRPAVRDLIYV